MEIYNDVIKLYKRNVSGQPLVWWANIDDYTDDTGIKQYRLSYHHGIMNGTISNTFSDPIVAKSKKNCYQQALFQLNSLYEKQKKKGYKSAEELGLSDVDSSRSFYDKLNHVLPKYNTDANNCVKPMKCQKFAIGKFTYPAMIQPKINGVRCIVMLEDYTPKDMFDSHAMNTDRGIKRVVMKTKEGLEYNVFHIEQAFKDFYTKCPEYHHIIFDGEIYIPNEKVTSIGGAARNPRNPLHSDLMFVNFDLSIPDMSNKDRDELRFKIWNDFIAKSSSLYVPYVFISISPESHQLFHKFSIVALNTNIVYSDNQALGYMQRCLDCGFEGAVIRDNNAEYQFGSRPQTMMKLKKFEDAEFECYDYKWSGDPEQGVGFSVVLLCKNDINDLTFESTVVGTVAERKAILDNPPIGKMVTIKFYERTKNGIPFHSNVIAIRDYE